MRTSLLVASVFAFALGCVTTQDLGGQSGGDDTSPAVVASVDPHQGFDPILPATRAECPAAVPREGGDCRDIHSARECAYAYRDLQLMGGVCGTSCVCARDGKWLCRDAPCPQRIDASVCVENMACAGSLSCWTQCDPTTPTSTCQSFTCVDGRLRPIHARPPR